MNLNQNDLEITLNMGYFLKNLDLISGMNVEWCEIQDTYRVLKRRSIKDLENQNDHNGGRDGN